MTKQRFYQVQIGFKTYYSSVLSDDADKKIWWWKVKSCYLWNGRRTGWEIIAESGLENWAHYPTAEAAKKDAEEYIRRYVELQKQCESYEYNPNEPEPEVEELPTPAQEEVKEDERSLLDFFGKS